MGEIKERKYKESTSGWEIGSITKILDVGAGAGVLEEAIYQMKLRHFLIK